MPELKYIKGAAKVMAEFRLRKERAAREDGVSVFVGFTQNYAIWVHEVPARHAVGNDKYLERPARQLGTSGVLGQIVGDVIKKGGTLTQGLVMAGLRLQREAQKQTPIDTGALKASAFTATEEKLEQAAASAYIRSQRIRDSELAQRAATGMS